MKTRIWENMVYISLALCIFGQIAVGWMYLVAQGAYLIANLISVVRSFALGRPTGDKVRDITFFTITVALIAVRLFG